MRETLEYMNQIEACEEISYISNVRSLLEDCTELIFDQKTEKMKMFLSIVFKSKRLIT
jgi:hypothetical protein